MDRLTIQIQPKSAFGTPIKGDTLFGQLCWFIRSKFGNQKLQELLVDYCNNRPFLSVSDAFPSGFLPRPELPSRYLFSEVDSSKRKQFKKFMMPTRKFNQPINLWSKFLCNPSEHSNLRNSSENSKYSQTLQFRTHNSISRITNTTGGEGFDPFTNSEIWFGEETRLDIHFVFDPNKIEPEEIIDLMRDIGAFGFGSDASTGKGRFVVSTGSSKNILPDDQHSANAWLTLAPCAPQGLNFDRHKSWYRIFTRFGRHGGVGAFGSFAKKTVVACRYRCNFFAWRSI